MQIFSFEKTLYRKTILVFVIFFSVAVVFAEQLFIYLVDRYAVTAAAIFSGTPIINFFDFGMSYFLNPLGVYAYLNSLILPVFSLLSLNLGINLFINEAQSNTIEFLLTKPFSRYRIFYGKTLYAFYYIILSSIIYFLGSLIALLIATGTDFSFKIFLLIFLTIPLINMVFTSLGLLLGNLFIKTKYSSAIALNIIIVFFLIGLIGAFSDDSSIKYFSPFQYFSGNYIIENKSLEPKFVLISISLVSIFVLLGYLVFRIREFHTGKKTA